MTFLLFLGDYWKVFVLQLKAAGLIGRLSLLVLHRVELESKPKPEYAHQTIHTMENHPVQDWRKQLFLAM